MGWKPAGPWAPAWPWELPGSFQHRTLHRGRWAARLVLESGQVPSFHSTLSPSLGTSWTLERWDSVSPGLQVASPAGRRLRPGRCVFIRDGRGISLRGGFTGIAFFFRPQVRIFDCVDFRRACH